VGPSLTCAVLHVTADSSGERFKPGTYHQDRDEVRDNGEQEGNDEEDKHNLGMAAWEM
jgi:hypothetical protein